MPRLRSNGLELEYDTFGSPADPPLVLVMGLGAQMITWDADFCGLLAAEGFHVVRFDNRDIGLSEYLDDLPLPDLQAIAAGDRSTVPYVLADMAADVAGLFDALGFAKAHVVGASMGGMIVQQLAIDHPDRLLSLCSIMSTTGDPTVGQADPAALQALLRPPAAGREASIAQSSDTLRILSSPGFPSTEEFFVAKATRAYDRAYHPAGGARQTAAVIASPDRTAALAGVRVPTLVIHGEADPLVGVSGGKATAAAIPDAELLIVAGMGHDLPRGAWQTLVQAIARNANG
ncbi:Pimeloyl-ACP methyl ester carboxylesterase [Amycolatopsis xylanica]|uniref:Pimeloyl-ACP methyl ester carboxylesterase n=1 Tax=Amycolatopsis xylanica TaxID=589385 RepID=A0A1H3MY44_9PSEU|nr:alpha/beta hydrolase [Amycolatopsis xylanica]SDY81400.1 Pimeloyl-ACP methyl ester carboxylesterase [Amycolatopsis xylanica]